MVTVCSWMRLKIVLIHSALPVDDALVGPSHDAFSSTRLRGPMRIVIFESRKIQPRYKHDY
jgi:hypothetical protein